MYNLPFLGLLNDLPGFFINLMYLLPGFLIGFTLHEYAHAWVAYKSGDDTAYLMGRLSFNPLKHIDWIGFACLIFAGFGWAKPVMINPSRVGSKISSHSRKFWFIWIAVGGVVVNLILAVVFMILAYIFSRYFRSSLTSILSGICYNGCLINLVLLFFNLIPIPPLDGSRVVTTCLRIVPRWYESIERYGMMIVILLIVTNVVSFYLRITAYPVFNLLDTLVGKLII